MLSGSNHWGINIGTESEDVMEASDLIKSVDKRLKEFAGANQPGAIEDIFTDSKRYRKIADRFWDTKVVNKKAA